MISHSIAAWSGTCATCGTCCKKNVCWLRSKAAAALPIVVTMAGSLDAGLEERLEGELGEVEDMTMVGGTSTGVEGNFR